MRLLALLVVVAAIAALLLTRAEPFAPTVTLETPVDFVGRATPIAVVANDRGTGLARVDVRLVPPGGGTPVVVATQSFPPGSGLLNNGATHEARVTATINAADAHVP